MLQPNKIKDVPLLRCFSPAAIALGIEVPLVGTCIDL